MGEVHTTLPLDIVSGAARAVLPVKERDCGEPCTRSQGMDGIREILSAARDNGLAAGHFLGLLHIAIGRKITRPDGSIVSAGFTWRLVAQELKNLRFDQELVREFGVEPDDLVSRDRERFWYSAIAQAHVDSVEAVTSADQLAPKLKNIGYIIGPAPMHVGGAQPEKTKPSEAKLPPAKPKEKEKESKSGKKKKK